eukprot:TRINITY_DN5027_c0_g1_i17.p1 TRINITY_DN5027_c0_g1~~TRINITY_DN5027_c0_g1_i17.p1  ORF type:complete len:194 (-),score=39.85 TRINITY_DN5027_c0_g1_i17:1237-1818(-)
MFVSLIVLKKKKNYKQIKRTNRGGRSQSMVWEDSNTPSLRVNNHFIDTCVLSPKVSNPTNTPKNVESLSSRRRNSEGYFVKPFSSLQLVPPEISQSSPVLPGNQFSECDVPVDRMRMAICGSLKEATLDELLLCYIYCTPSISIPPPSLPLPSSLYFFLFPSLPLSLPSFSHSLSHCLPLSLSLFPSQEVYIY